MNIKRGKGFFYWLGQIDKSNGLERCARRKGWHDWMYENYLSGYYGLGLVYGNKGGKV
jgi:hypothetical protein